MTNSHMLPNLLVFIFWIIFFAYWLISAIGVKKNIHNDGWRRSAGIRILLIVVVIILLNFTSFFQFSGYQFNHTAQIIGVVLCGAGIAFAIWARWHLGKNWSGIPSMKEDHELVTSGPYRLARHPIYTGMIAALVGSALVGGAVWFVVVIILSIMFLYRIPVEERYMMQLFPDQYPDYKKKVKALIPFVW